MKKYIIYSGIVLFAVLLSASGNRNSVYPASNLSDTTIIQPEAAPYQIRDNDLIRKDLLHFFRGLIFTQDLNAQKTTFTFPCNTASLRKMVDNINLDNGIAPSFNIQRIYYDRGISQKSKIFVKPINDIVTVKPSVDRRMFTDSVKYTVTYLYPTQARKIHLSKSENNTDTEFGLIQMNINDIESDSSAIEVKGSPLFVKKIQTIQGYNKAGRLVNGRKVNESGQENKYHFTNDVSAFDIYYATSYDSIVYSGSMKNFLIPYKNNILKEQR